MKPSRNPSLPRRLQVACMLALALGGNGLLLPSHATSISEVPLINSQVSVKPNLMFILDNSGSMNWDYIPDDISDTDRYAYWSNHCNGAAFNPDASAAAYARPTTPDGRDYPQMDPAYAWSDGFQPTLSSTTYDLNVSLNTNTPDPSTSTVVNLTITIYAQNKPWLVGDRIGAYERIDSSTVDKTHWLIGSVTALSSSGYNHTYTIQFTFSSVRKGTVSSWVIGKLSTTDLTATTNGVSNRYFYRYSGSETAMDWKYTSNGSFDTSSNFVNECRSSIGNAPGSGVFTRVNFSSLSTSDRQRYANWYSYYRKRILMMRSAAGRAMFTLDNRYRVGFSSLNKDGSFNGSVSPSLGHFADIADFDTSHKMEFFSNLYGSTPDGSTPLRRSLAKAGRYYGNKFTGQSDPVQHACQRNYSLLTTDGYWNESTNPTQLDGSTAIGNQDGILATSPRPEYDNSQDYTAVEQRTNYRKSSTSGCSGSRARYRSFTEQRSLTSVPAGITYSEWVEVPGTLSSEGSCRSSAPSASGITTINQVGGPVSNSLADVAAYYYKTDLRPDLLDSVPYSTDDPNRKQHMTTYTLGLGQNGTLPYDANYLGGSSAAYNGLVAGTVNWPAPSADAPTTIDDLWHAAVNGHGRYFSASNATTLTSSLVDALNSINSREGAGAAAAATSQRQVTGTDQTFKASYLTQAWTGEIEAVRVVYNTATSSTGLSDTADWLASTHLNSRSYSGRDIRYMRRTTSGGQTTASLGNFNYTDLGTDADGTALQALFNNYCSKTPTPSQCSALTAEQKTSASGENLVNFLRGDRSNESVLYRTRRSVLGDMVDASPVHVGKPAFEYRGGGYPAFAAEHVNRCPTLYVAANDGMLHAFSAKSTRTQHASCPTGGVEIWAYVPRAAMPRMYMLADKDYANQHRFFLNATPVVGDVSTTASGTTTWRTVLVGGMGAGGRSYYALDITDPASPVPLWEFSDADLGLSYGNPVITQVPDTSGNLFWAVVFTSGINNNGNGYLYVLDAMTGAVVYKVPTLVAGDPVGTSANPNGLNKLNAWVNSPSDNVASRFYAGDMFGNLWRFDANNLTPPPAGSVKTADARSVRIAQFKIGTIPQPITTVPLLAEVSYSGNRYPVVLVGTGRYLGDPDVLDTTTRNSVYAVRDPLDSSGWTDVRTQMVAKTLDATTKMTDNSTVNWGDTQVAGWYVDLPDAGERVAVNMELAYTTLTVPTVVPANDVCTGSGYSWKYKFNIASGISLTAAVKTTVAIMGVTTVQFISEDGLRTTGGEIVTMADGEVRVQESALPSGTTSLRRTSWRELTP